MSDYNILCINPGSTSTKLAIFKGGEKMDETNIEHPAEEISKYANIISQLPMRKEAVIQYLQAHDMQISDFDAIAARGCPDGKHYHAGAYEIDQDMVDSCMLPQNAAHPMCLAPVIAFEWVKEYGIPAYSYDVVYVDELKDVARVTGLSGIERNPSGHTLNTKAVAREVARKMGAEYKDLNLIMCHLGGGCSVSMHEHGRITDIVAGGEGSFTPSRAGRLSYKTLIKMCFSGTYTEAGLRNMFNNKSGFVALLGTNDCREVEKRIEKGDKEAQLLYDAFAYNIAKDIGMMAVTTAGKVDRIVLTGGIAFSEMLTSKVSELVSFIAPVVVYPGAIEMEALAMGVTRVLRGEETVHKFCEED